MALYIRNPGEIERGALSLLGASVKDGDQIGKFGSGFKYSIATLIREGVAFRIFSGMTEIIITTEIEKFRDKEFKVLMIDGMRTSITTRTGPEWTVRDAVREIWSNALDEGEAEKFVAQSAELKPGTTLIEIDDSNRAVKSMIVSWEKHFVHDVPHLHRNHYGRIISQPTTNYFRRGVWICEDRDMAPLFSYDFRDVKLPESRKINSGALIYNLYSILCLCDEPKVFEAMLDNLSSKLAEWRACDYYSMINCPGAKTLETVFKSRWEFFGNEQNKDQVAKMAGTRKVLWVNNFFANYFHRLGLPNIEAEVSFDDAYEVLDWPIGYEERLEEPLRQLKAIGIDYDSFPIVYGKARDDKDGALIAFADMKKKRCVLTDAAFEATPQMLMKSLVEEWTHLEHGVRDGSVDQQHVYLNLIVKLIERMK